MMQKLIRLAAWASILAVFVFTDGPIGMRPITSLPPNAERLLAFAVIGGLFGLSYPRRPVLILAVLVALAGCFELLQFGELGRHARFSDFGVKAAGACIGVAAGALAHRTLIRASMS
jgi:hypothetical protein